jgi:hypothetical protein
MSKRQVYEIEADRKRALKVIMLFCEVMGGGAVDKQGTKFSPIDFLLVKKDDLTKPYAYAEVKAHFLCKVDTHQRKMIENAKWQPIRKMCHKTGLPAYIIFAFPDDDHRVFYFKYVHDAGIEPEIEIGGRTQKTGSKAIRDKGDRGMMAYFKHHWLTELKWREHRAEMLAALKKALDDNFKTEPFNE